NSKTTVSSFDKELHRSWRGLLAASSPDYARHWLVLRTPKCRGVWSLFSASSKERRLNRLPCGSYGPFSSLNSLGQRKHDSCWRNSPRVRRRPNLRPKLTLRSCVKAAGRHNHTRNHTLSCRIRTGGPCAFAAPS